MIQEESRIFKFKLFNIDEIIFLEKFKYRCTEIKKTFDNHYLCLLPKEYNLNRLHDILKFLSLDIVPYNVTLSYIVACNKYDNSFFANIPNIENYIKCTYNSKYSFDNIATFTSILDWQIKPEKNWINYINIIYNQEGNRPATLYQLQDSFVKLLFNNYSKRKHIIKFINKFMLTSNNGKMLK